MLLFINFYLVFIVLYIVLLSHSHSRTEALSMVRLRVAPAQGTRTLTRMAVCTVCGRGAKGVRVGGEAHVLAGGGKVE